MTRHRLGNLSSVLGVILLSAMVQARGATLCVNPGGTKGCKATIKEAVAAASPGDTILVAKGTYSEDVTIGIPLSLIGDDAANPVIDATGKGNGINVDGYNNPGLNHVTVSGFTVKNANFQGILVINASYVTVVDNLVTGNNKALVPGNPPTCPGIPAYLKAGEDFDCGEGIHLTGVDHSTVSQNVVRNNAGGILLSDDTGSTHDNLISENVVQDNPLDCGITLASHHFSTTPDPTWVGVSHNTITRNSSSRNGLTSGEGAGVGLFTGPPGGRTNGNVVTYNILTGNGLPGVTMHSHAFNQNLNDNLIVGNVISGNGGDPDATAPNAPLIPTGIVVFSDAGGGAQPITGTVILHNTIRNEGIDIEVLTDGAVDAHFNNLFDAVGVANVGAATANGPARVDATENWWKCPGGPGAHGCGDVQVGASAGPVLTTPWLTRPWQAR
jgi:parallel beta-helix repeat protein